MSPFFSMLTMKKTLQMPYFIFIKIHKSLFFGMLFLGISSGLCQQMVPGEEASVQREISMSNTIGKSVNGAYTYFAVGDKEPFTGILFARYPNGNYSSRQSYVNGRGQGKWINYHENGNFKEVGYYNNDRVEGPIRKYHENGMLKAEGQYKDWRIKVGEWKYYDQAGVLISTHNYGEKGSIEEVQAYYNRGDIPYSWFRDILRKNGFKE